MGSYSKNIKDMNTLEIQNIRLTGIVAVAAILLSIPFFAMQFTNEVKWNWFDFLIAGILLFGTGLTIEFVLRKVIRLEYRLALCAAILIGLFLIWAELAVGIFGTPLAGS